MMLGPYHTTSTIYEDAHVGLYRGKRSQDGKRVFLKRLKLDGTNKFERSRLRHEFDVTTRLKDSGLEFMIACEEHNDNLLIVMEDFGGEFLDHCALPLPLEQFLNLAISLAETLEEIHKHRFFYKNLKPSMILWNPEAKKTQFIEFCFTEKASEQLTSLEHPLSIYGALDYISPEQTGRMNREVDFRSDLYSLGVLYYQLLTGKLPFHAPDPLGTIHLHLAGSPLAPHKIDAEIPEMISHIIMKLLAKLPNDRYQSVGGLISDLSHCNKDLQSQGRVKPFKLAEHDYSDRLAIPQKLYGREKEIDQLLGAVNRVRSGDCELFLVEGYSGIGKTALVHEVRRLILEKGGCFIEGKFDQLQRNVPYYGWIQAFTSFVNYLLMESKTKLEYRKELIKKSVGPVGRVLVDIIPNMEKIFDFQVDIPILGATEAKNRFNYAFLEFVKAIATEERPLVVFLDDLQWIDAASLKLIETLMTGNGVSNILIIGSYRDNEVDALHPLSISLDSLRKENVSIHRMTLGELSKDTVNKIIADTLHCHASKTASLTQLIFRKTRGNPFFMLQTLLSLRERESISFNHNSRTWEWDIATIENMGITDNVVSLMEGKIRELPSETQYLLPLAACIGFQFCLSNLCHITGQSKEQTLGNIQFALREGLIESIEGYYQFAHDRIQQAAYAMLPDKERVGVHWKIGRRLFLETDLCKNDEQIFDIVNHLNAGVGPLKNQKELIELVELNLQAGKKAKASSAFQAALGYFEAGLKLLGKDSWENNYSQTLSLYQEATEASCLCGDYNRMRNLASITHQRVRSVHEEVRTYSSEIRAHTAQGELVPAIQLGLKALKRLGMNLPEKPSSTDAENFIQRTLLLLHQRTIKGISQQPLMTSQDQLACTFILSEIGEPAYAGSPYFFLVWASSLAELSLQYGNCELSPFAYAAYALALCATGVHIETGSRLAKEAISMIDALGAQSQRCRLLNIYGCTIQPWTEHLRDTLCTLSDAVNAGAESGDFTSGSYAAFNSCTAAFFMGEPLEAETRRMILNLRIIANMKQTYIWNWVAIHVLLTLKLRGVKDLPKEVSAFDETAWLGSAKEANDQCGLAYYHLGMLIENYLSENHDAKRVLFHIEAVETNIAGFQGAFAVPVFYFYSSLALLQLGFSNRTGDSSPGMEKIYENLKKLKDLAQFGPMNLQHKCDLLAAELARLENRNWQAVQLYEKAIEGARTNGFLQESALSNEMAAKFYLEQNMKDTGQFHLRNAYKEYTQWQAGVKLTVLETKYPQLLDRRKVGTSALDLRLLDMDTVIKATHAISSKIKMERLLSEVMHIVIENAGAQIGFLLFEQEGAWQIVAKGGVLTQDVEMPIPIGMDDCNLIARSVVRFVARTKESVVLEDVAFHDEFRNDPHIMMEKTRALVCIPLLNRGRLIGILYLENNLAEETFTPERCFILESIAAQAAISLEISSVYESLHESEENYRTLLQNIHAAVVVHRPDTRIVTSNSVAQELLGITEEQMLGKKAMDPSWDFLFEDGKPMPQEKYPVNQVLATGQKITDFIVGVHRPNKEEKNIWVLSNADPVFDKDNRIVQVIVTFFNITELKRAQEEIHNLNQELDQRVLQRTAQLEAANKELEAFAYSVSHDLRAPLRHIDSFLGLLRKEIGASLGNKERHYMNVISESAQKMDRLIEDLLSFSRMGRQEMSCKQVDLKSLVIDLKEQLSYDMDEDKIRWHIGDLPLVQGDEPMLRVAFTNLLSNAVKFSGNKKHPRIDVGHILRESVHIIFIKDNGVGFDQAHTKKLFGVFQRLHREDEFEGTGVGLATTQRILLRHGGKIWAEGKPGIGATFYVSLPCED